MNPGASSTMLQATYVTPPPLSTARERLPDVHASRGYAPRRCAIRRLPASRRAASPPPGSRVRHPPQPPRVGQAPGVAAARVPSGVPAVTWAAGHLQRCFASDAKQLAFCSPGSRASPPGVLFLRKGGPHGPPRSTGSPLLSAPAATRCGPPAVGAFRGATPRLSGGSVAALAGWTSFHPRLIASGQAAPRGRPRRRHPHRMPPRCRRNQPAAGRPRLPHCRGYRTISQSPPVACHHRFFGPGGGRPPPTRASLPATGGDRHPCRGWPPASPGHNAARPAPSHARAGGGPRQEEAAKAAPPVCQ